MSRCNNGESPLDRFIAVVTWSISTVRPVIFGVAPYNPILGETHHVSRGNLNVLLEQVLFFFAFLDSFLLLPTLNNNSLKSFWMKPFITSLAVPRLVHLSIDIMHEKIRHLSSQTFQNLAIFFETWDQRGFQACSWYNYSLVWLEQQTYLFSTLLWLSSYKYPFCRFHITHQYLPSMQLMRVKMLKWSGVIILLQNSMVLKNFILIFLSLPLETPPY